MKNTKIPDDDAICWGSGGGKVEWNPIYKPKEQKFMKQFDLIEAVKGAKLCTAFGTEMTVVHYDSQSEYLMVRLLPSGKPSLISLKEAMIKLFILPKKVTKYMNVYKTIHGVIGSCFLYDSEAEAINKSRTGLGETYIKTISFEVEE